MLIFSDKIFGGTTSIISPHTSGLRHAGCRALL